MKTKKHTKDAENVLPHLHREPGGFQMTWWPSATWGNRTWKEAVDACKKEFLRGQYTAFLLLHGQEEQRD